MHKKIEVLNNVMACPTCQTLSADEKEIENILPLKYSKDPLGYYCPSCDYLYPILDNIVVALPKHIIEKENPIAKIKDFQNKHKNVKSSTIEMKYLTYKHYVRFRNYGLISKKLDKKDNRSIIYDLGCGGGAFSKYYDTGSYIGLEIELKRLLVASLNRKNIYILGDILHLPFKNNSISKFVCCSVIEHTPDFSLALMNLRRVSSGIGYIAIPARDTFNFFDDPINFTRLLIGKKPIEFGAFAYGHMGMLKWKEWEKLIAKHHFNILETTTEKIPIIAQFIALLVNCVFFKKNFSDLPVGFVAYSRFKRISILWKLIRKLDFSVFSKYQTTEFYVGNRADLKENTPSI